MTTRLFRFIGEGAKKYELGMDFVERNYDHITDLANPKAAVRLIETGSYQKLYAQAGHFFKTDKLRKAFTFHSMFLGLSPFDALAMYSLITYADLVEGMKYPDGRHLQHHRGHGGAGGRDGRNAAHRHAGGGDPDRKAARRPVSGWPAARS